MLEVAVELRARRVADVDGVCEVESVARAVVGRQERIGLLLSGDVHALVGVRERKTVQVHHERCADLGVLGHRVGHKRQVKRLLVVLRVRLHPAVVHKRQAVALVAVDVPRQRGGAVRVHHDDGEAAARGVGQALGHVQQALARRGRERARARGRRADGA